ncbi:MAG: BolA/IbaG family iron-sulfur metabolism protein [Porticoccaceae bacterium]|nr:BolA/IbaG family iron-sulfur metabolism protein [Porticoccaceae bacterium]
MGAVEESILTSLNSLRAEHVDVSNESHMHAVPRNSETHFKLVLVSESFVAQRSVKRHQMVYGLLAEQLKGPVHALALHTYTPDEWRQKNHQSPNSPDCLGGGK